MITNTLTLLILAIAVFIINPASSNPVLDSPRVLDTKKTFEELSDLNKDNSNGGAKSQAVLSNAKVLAPFVHRDEDQSREETIVNRAESVKYDFEILEDESNIKKENIEIEERFRGPAISVDTDMFIAENIEVHGGEIIQQSHMILTVILVVVALISIGLYAALVIWRSHLEQRYGMRELLVNDDDYCQQNHSFNSTEGDANNARHFSVMQQ